jgi:hypothetical protein
VLNRKLTYQLLCLTAIALPVTILAACQPAPTTPSKNSSENSVTATVKPQASSPVPTSTSIETSKTEPKTDPKADPKADPKTETKPSPITLQSLSGNYKTVFGDEAMQAAQKQGIKDVSGKWLIKVDGSFEAILKLDKQEVKTTGLVKLDGKKAISQVETVNGQKPPQNSEPTIFTISDDGKTWQAEGQPIKLVKQ